MTAIIPQSSAIINCQPLERRMLLSSATLPVSAALAAALDDVPGGARIYMRYGDIQGEVAVRGAEGMIALNSLQWGVGRAVSSYAGGGRETSQPSLSDITITKRFDGASISLIEETFGDQAADVEIDLVRIVKRTATPYLTIKLSDVLISGYSMSSGGGIPSESLSLNFGKISLISGNRTTEYDPVAAKSAAVQVASAFTSRKAARAKSTLGVKDPWIFMKYGDISGDVTTRKASGSIDVKSFQWGVGRSISRMNGDRSSSAPSVSEIVVTKGFDSASVPLIQEAFVGEPEQASIDFASVVKRTATPYLQISLSDVLVSGYSASSGGDRPTESLSLNFARISLQSTGASGEKQSFDYDLTTQKASFIQPASALSKPAASKPAAARAKAADNPAAGGSGIFMEYGDIKGDVTTRKAGGSIGVQSFQWGVGRGVSSPSGGNRETSAPSISEITVGKRFDSASLPLIGEAFSGEPAAAQLDFATIVKRTATPYLTIKLSDTLISGYSTSSSGDRPTESLSLNFTKISFTALGKNGQSQTFEYDLAKQAV